MRSFDYRKLLERTWDHEMLVILRRSMNIRAGRRFAPYETASTMEQVCESFNQMLDTQEIDPLLLIPVVIHDFLCIHPFNDGNGRMSRLLTTLLLYRSGYMVGKYISLESKIAKNKNLYYDVLEQSQGGWHEGTDDCTASPHSLH